MKRKKKNFPGSSNCMAENVPFDWTPSRLKRLAYMRACFTHRSIMAESFGIGVKSLDRGIAILNKTKKAA